MNEIWKDIKGYENRYQVSNIGRIRSLGRTFVNKLNRTVTRKGQIIKGRVNRNGYRYCALYDHSSTRKTQKFHRKLSDCKNIYPIIKNRGKF